MDSTITEGKEKRRFMPKLVDYFRNSNKQRPDKKVDFGFIPGPNYSGTTGLGLGFLGTATYSADRSDPTLPRSNASIYSNLTTAGFFLLGVYTGVLLWLLFWRERTAEGIPYLHRLPMHLNLSPLRTIRLYLRLLRSSQPHLVRIALVNLAGNIVMFLPLGFLPPLLFSGLRRWYRMLPAAAGIIAAAELLQMLLLVGTCDVDDLILNLLGTAAGYGLFALTKNRRQKADS